MLYPNSNAGMMSNKSNNAPCTMPATMPTVPLLAHAYVPFQNLVSIYPPMKGLAAGTIFPELDRPYGVDPEYTVDA
ncbi:spore coat associated protein CotJA [Acetivibrio cellulolyticus]|uniref:spore coat associated protein CotJA n=1 Tax=Acetivibrio cellulolyticus TaxID=35830 RepID=UPI0001E2CBEF|nr:spore coat associated protein CotJA [Acetivibrio cellulolyticus]